jgi:uncharacterized protein (DUF2235 family)
MPCKARWGGLPARLRPLIKMPDDDPIPFGKGGILGEGLLQNLSEAYQNLIFNYTPGDELFVFGFSRGAFTARSFCGLLSNSGILDRRHASEARRAIELYRSRQDSSAHLDQMMTFRRDYCSDIVQPHWTQSARNLPASIQ